MTQRVPEFAALTAVASALGAGGFVAWVGELADAVVVAACVVYPFLAYAVVRDDDPTGVLPPAAVAVVGIAVGLVPLAGVFVSGRLNAGSVAAAAPVGTGLAFQPLAYVGRYGTGGPAPRPP